MLIYDGSFSIHNSLFRIIGDALCRTGRTALRKRFLSAIDRYLVSDGYLRDHPNLRDEDCEGRQRRAFAGEGCGPRGLKSRI